MAKNRKSEDAQEVSEQVDEATGTIVTMLRNTIETQPYTAVAIALGLGWLFGRTHRPF
jgi:ElaB/YqjD/DUF883 family membrane-anchored ribosome-binding protein